jgi:prophage regulatory protein
VIASTELEALSMHAHKSAHTAERSHERSVFLRMRSVISMTGLARSTIYRLVAQKQFPSPLRLAVRAIAWRRADLERWIAARPTITH